jgi:hypothetical protein
MILTSEPLIQLQKTNMQDLFKTSYGRSYFSKIVFQQKFKEYKYHCLSADSFNDLYEMLFLAILQSNDETPSNYESVRLLTKSTFFYYK